MGYASHSQWLERSLSMSKKVWVGARAYARNVLKQPEYAKMSSRLRLER